MDIASGMTVLLGMAALIGIGLTIIQLRQLMAQRRTDMIVKISPWFAIDFNEWQEISNAILSSDFKDYDDFIGKYGPMNIDNPLQRSIATLSNFYEGIGVLLKRGLVEEDLLRDLYGDLIIATWEKMSPLVAELRKRSPNAWSNYEHLYNTMNDSKS